MEAPKWNVVCEHALPEMVLVSMGRLFDEEPELAEKWSHAHACVVSPGRRSPESVRHDRLGRQAVSGVCGVLEQ